jgi:hypothetical protein
VLVGSNESADIGPEVTAKKIYYMEATPRNGLAAEVK